MCLSEFNEHSGQVLGISELKTGDVISWSSDKTVKIWSQINGECLKSSEIGVVCLKVCDFGHIVALLEDNCINVYDINFEMLNSIKSDGKILCFEITKNFNILIGYDDGKFRVFKKETIECIKVIQAHQKPVTFLNLLNENEVISASDEGLKIWNLKTWECLSVYEAPVCHVQVINNSEFLTVGSDIKLWNKNNDNCLKIVTVHEKKSNITMSQVFDDDNCCIILRTDDSVLEEFDFASNKVKKSAEFFGVKCFKVLKSGFLFTGLNNGSIKKWLTK